MSIFSKLFPMFKKKSSPKAEERIKPCFILTDYVGVRIDDKFVHFNDYILYRKHTTQFIDPDMMMSFRILRDLGVNHIATKGDYHFKIFFKSEEELCLFELTYL